jgi:hypothetical protein
MYWQLSLAGAARRAPYHEQQLVDAINEALARGATLRSADQA